MNIERYDVDLAPAELVAGTMVMDADVVDAELARLSEDRTRWVKVKDDIPRGNVILGGWNCGGSWDKAILFIPSFWNNEEVVATVKMWKFTHWLKDVPELPRVSEEVLD